MINLPGLKRIARMWVGGVAPELEAERLAAAVLYRMSKDTEIVQATKTHQLNWWGFVLELFLTISE